MTIDESNIVYIKTIKQFGVVLYITPNGYRVLNIGVVPFEECIFLNKESARILDNSDESWNRPSKEIIEKLIK